MTNFNADPRVRDREPDSTGLGPNFPSSLNDLWRMVFRPSENYLRYVKIAVSNDDGTRVAQQSEETLAEILAELKTMNATLAGILRTREEPTG